MENLKRNTKVKSREESAYTKWLNELSNGRTLLEELNEEEIYKIIYRISELTFSRNPILNQDHTFEDAANIIYRNYLLRDKEKNLDTLSDIKTEDFPYYDEKTGKYFKEWRPRKECKGFNRMYEQGMTITKFSNTIFRELKNHVSWHTRDIHFQNLHNNSISLDYETEDVKMVDKIGDTKDYYKEVEEDLDLDIFIKDLNNDEADENYIIEIGEERRILSYGNLLKLYSYLASGKRVSSGEILKHIIYNGSRELSKDNIKYIGRFISSFKKHLLDTGIVNMSTYINNGREKKRYGFN